MKVITTTTYECFDGKQFDSLLDAANYEAIVRLGNYLSPSVAKEIVNSESFGEIANIIQNLIHDRRRASYPSEELPPFDKPERTTESIIPRSIKQKP